MNKEELRSFVNNIEHIPYISLDNEQKQMISDFVKDYDNLQSQLDIANKKFKEIKNHCNISTTYEFNEIKNNHNSFDHQRIINNNNEILSIIGGE